MSSESSQRADVFACADWLVSLSKLVSHALRHEPWLYELELDDEGWVPIADLLVAVRRQGHRWRDADQSDLEEIIQTSAKTRYEIGGEKIRALYGHSVPGCLSRQPAEPPPMLHHGTSPAAAEAIVHEGLRPMRRQYVHLSKDIETARQVGKRKAITPIVMKVRATDAFAAGVAFYRGNEYVWLADNVPPAYLAIAER